MFKSHVTSRNTGFSAAPEAPKLRPGLVKMEDDTIH